MITDSNSAGHLQMGFLRQRKKSNFVANLITGSNSAGSLEWGFVRQSIRSHIL